MNDNNQFILKLFVKSNNPVIFLHSIFFSFQLAELNMIKKSNF